MSVITADIDQWYFLQSKAHEFRVASAFEKFRANGIEPILIKGWAAARKYPEYHPRWTGDIDLAVAPELYEACGQFINEIEIAKLHIDLHRSLRQLDSVEWADLFDHSVLIDVQGTPVRILCEEDHLRVLSTHWLVDGGGYKEKLWDIAYAVQNRKPDFDWGRCMNVVSPIRRGWVICAIALATGISGSTWPIFHFRKS